MLLSQLSPSGRELLLQPLGRHPRLQWAYDRVRRYMLQAADGVFPVSRYTADRLLGLGVAEARCHVVPNGVDETEIAEIKAEIAAEIAAEARNPTPTAELVYSSSYDRGLEEQLRHGWQ